MGSAFSLPPILSLQRLLNAPLCFFTEVFYQRMGRKGGGQFLEPNSKNYFSAPVLDDVAAPLWVLRECEVPFRCGYFFHHKISSMIVSASLSVILSTMIYNCKKGLMK
jgi:hypothetical protein